MLAAMACSGGHDRPQGDADAPPDFGSDLDSPGEGGDPADGGEGHDAAPDRPSDVPDDGGDGEDGDGCIPAGCVPAGGDMDCDTIPDDADDCPECFNECQEDRDGDGIGDACDDSCEESCIGGSCGAEGIAGCNCTACSEGAYCIGDAQAPVGICDGSGTYSFCAPVCTDTRECPAPLACQSIAGRCLCARTFPSAPVCRSDPQPELEPESEPESEADSGAESEPDV